MQPVPRSVSENFEYVYQWIRRLDRRISRASRADGIPRETREAEFLSGVTLGNGSATLHEWTSAGTVFQSLDFLLGSSTSITGDIVVDTGYENIADGVTLLTGSGRFLRSGTAFQLAVVVSGNSSRLRVVKTIDPDTQWVVQENADVISDWEAGSRVSASWYFPAT